MTPKSGVGDVDIGVQKFVMCFCALWYCGIWYWYYGIYGIVAAFSCNSHSAGNTQLKSTVKQGESQVTEVKNKNVYNLRYSAFDPSLKFSNGMTLLPDVGSGNRGCCLAKPCFHPR